MKTWGLQVSLFIVQAVPLKEWKNTCLLAIINLQYSEKRIKIIYPLLTLTTSVELSLFWQFARAIPVPTPIPSVTGQNLLRNKIRDKIPPVAVPAPVWIQTKKYFRSINPRIFNWGCWRSTIHITFSLPILMIPSATHLSSADGICFSEGAFDILRVLVPLGTLVYSTCFYWTFTETKEKEITNILNLNFRGNVLMAVGIK